MKRKGEKGTRKEKYRMKKEPGIMKIRREKTKKEDKRKRMK